MKYQLSIAAHLEYLSPDTATKLDQQAEELVRVLAGLIRSLRAEA